MQNSNNFIKVFNEVKNSIKSLTGKKISENDTKEVLISRLLRELSWNIYDPQEVKREYKHKNHPDSADFALILNNKPVLLIEAKELNNLLDNVKDWSQAMNYASNVGIKWSILTNGNRYLFFNSNAQEDYENKLFKEFHIEKMNDSDALEFYNILSKESISRGNIENIWKHEYYTKTILDIIQNLFNESDMGLVNLIKKKSNPEMKMKKEDIITVITSIKDNIDFQSLGVDADEADLSEKEIYTMEWDKESLKKYFNTLKKYNKRSTLGFFSILVNSNVTIIKRKDLINQIGEKINNPSFNGYGLSGVLAGITMNCNNNKKEIIINKSENRKEFSIKDKYKEIIKSLL